MNGPRLIVGMESSGHVRDAFRAVGIDAWSCDLLDCEGDPRWHIRGDVFRVLRDQHWDAGIFHPECTYICSSGLHWNNRVPGRHASTLRGLHHVRLLMDCGLPMWAIENPRGLIGTHLRPSSQTLQPHDYGEDASKETRLWLHGLPKLRPTGRHHGRVVERDPGDLFGGGVERWANQSDSGNNNLPESATRWRDRSRTYPGIARAMAEQWGPWIMARCARKEANDG